MKKIINLGQKPQAEYSCQVCHKNEAVLRIKGSGGMFRIQGKFCGPCAIERIKCRNPANTPKDFRLICSECGCYRDRQVENNHFLQSLDMECLLNKIARRMKK